MRLRPFPTFGQTRLLRATHANGAGAFAGLMAGPRWRWQALILRVLLLVMCLNASLMWSMHCAMHIEREQATASLAEQAPANDDTGPAHDVCSQCQLFAHQIAPAQQPDTLHPAIFVLAVRHDFPAPPTLGRSWLHFPRDPPSAS